MKISKIQKKKRIHLRVRKKVSGTAERPRLSVYRSNKQIYCQLIGDIKEVTLACASSKDAAITASGNKVDTSFAVGKLLAEKALASKIENVVFDRGGYLYHGRVKAVADGAREGGLKF